MAADGVQTPLSAEQLFDQIGPAYEIAFEGLSTQAAAIDWVLKELLHRRPAKCLDIGCGTGVPVCSSLAKAGHDVLGIDVSGVMIEDAMKKDPDAMFQRVDIADYQPGEAKFDCITVFFSTIASVTQEQIRQNIRNVYQWLKPGGIFVFATVPVAGESMDIKWMDKLITVSSLEADEAVECIRSAGFSVDHHALTTFTPYAAKANICEDSAVWEEPHLFVYAKKE